MAIRRFSTSNLTGGKSSKLWDQETFPGYFESIATVVVGSAGSATIDFTNMRMKEWMEKEWSDFK